MTAKEAVDHLVGVAQAAPEGDKTGEAIKVFLREYKVAAQEARRLEEIIDQFLASAAPQAKEQDLLSEEETRQQPRHHSHFEQRGGRT